MDPMTHAVTPRPPRPPHSTNHPRCRHGVVATRWAQCRRREIQASAADAQAEQDDGEEDGSDSDGQSTVYSDEEANLLDGFVVWDFHMAKSPACACDGKCNCTLAYTSNTEFIERIRLETGMWSYRRGSDE